MNLTRFALLPQLVAYLPIHRPRFLGRPQRRLPSRNLNV
jgi:hypothetical protein